MATTRTLPEHYWPPYGHSDSHTYGAQCRLAPVPQPRSDDPWLQDIPPSNAQFFYTAVVPIDDPLSSATVGEAKVPKLPLRPFSHGDSNALETAWLRLSSDSHHKNHAVAQSRQSPGPAVIDANNETLALVVRNLSARHRLMHAVDGTSTSAADTGAGTAVLRATLRRSDSGLPICCEQLPVDAATELSALFCPVALSRQEAVNVDKVVLRVMAAMSCCRPATTVASDRVLEPCAMPQSAVSTQSPHSSRQLSIATQPSAEGFSRHDAAPSGLDNATTGLQMSPAFRASRVPGATDHGMVSTSSPVPLPVRSSVVDDGISGTPFLRTTMPESLPEASQLSSLLRDDRIPPSNGAIPAPPVSDSKNVGAQSALPDDAYSCAKDHDALAAEIQETSRLLRQARRSTEVVVGVSRLHTVDLPSLHMKPIYWSPINDVATVQRATWFYRDTMMPLEPTVANQLEWHYRELRPWSETWAIELRCAVDIGPEGEEKVSQPLWPKSALHGHHQTMGGQATLAPKGISSNPLCAAWCCGGAAAAEGSLEAAAAVAANDTATKDANDTTVVHSASAKGFANYHVAFKDGRTAFLLKPSLWPSAYYGRRPIAKISKGVTVGIPVVRGFDRYEWKRMHNKTPSDPMVKDIQSMPAYTGDRLAGCPRCMADKAKSQVDDLVLVVHGVGQKLAERVESFHFTHAVNGLRRAMNTELNKSEVRPVLRENLNGIMVLPINWRHTLSFEDGGFAGEPSQEEPSIADDRFGLKDIEPTSIPAVRSMISDVMFDIPFYMSHHKPKMIQSLVREANRVYHLWCQNNPGFANHGRVHLIGHSLGSAMAIEVLSKQPTTLPRALPYVTPMPESSHFEFDTKNLFLLGSPSAFFLLLQHGALVPRRGRQKPGIGVQDSQDGRVVGETGAFGCLAVDNVFNVLAKEDPIAYLLNGTIDKSYAANLKTAYVPSASLGILQSISHSVRQVFGASAPSGPSVAPFMVSQNPPPILRLPSQLELEVHDFTREEIAERKAYLLNDNGQVDYFLQSGGGPLEIQYLNMLSAHTSYWTNQDLIRMLCVEIGRHPGRAYTLPAMRAVKAQKRALPTK